MNWGIMEIIEATGATPDRLPKRLPVLTGISTDSRTVRKGELFVALKGPTHDGHQFVGAALARGARAILAQDPISVERKVPCLFVPDTLHAYGALASSYRKRLRARLSAITGSMGKTTTKEMAATILARKYKVAKTRENENNRVGVPKTLLSIEPDTDVAVIELGSNIPGEISLLAGIVGADRALVTNIAPVHLERFKTLEGVRIEKSALFWASPKETLRCINRDDPHIRKIPLKPEWPTLTYGTGKSSQVRATHVKPLGLEGIQFTLTAAGENIDISLPLLGTHQVKNALAAATLGILEGISLAEIKEALASFRAPGKRLEAISTASRHPQRHLQCQPRGHQDGPRDPCHVRHVLFYHRPFGGHAGARGRNRRLPRRNRRRLREKQPRAPRADRGIPGLDPQGGHPARIRQGQDLLLR
ncbi:MAG: hypothetical protein DSY91_06705 [Deltaproteobacteria bacterium]|nr:MAG: hypothetical protein DSY91_06705 [Deltaproteobacteria bacterium]